MNPLDVVGRQRQFQVVRVTRDQSANQVDLLERHLGRFAACASSRPAHRRTRIGRPCPPRRKRGKIGIQRRLRLRDIELVEARVPFGPQLPGQIVMPVDQDCTAVQLARAGRSTRPAVAYRRPRAAPVRPLRSMKTKQPLRRQRKSEARAQVHHFQQSSRVGLDRVRQFCPPAHEQPASGLLPHKTTAHKRTPRL